MFRGTIICVWLEKAKTGMNIVYQCNGNFRNDGNLRSFGDGRRTRWMNNYKGAFETLALTVLMSLAIRMSFETDRVGQDQLFSHLACSNCDQYKLEPLLEKPKSLRYLMSPSAASYSE